MRPQSICAPLLLLLASCSSPPQPPSVDEASKRPANSPAAVELQVCKSDLQNTRISVKESVRSAQVSGQTVARLVQQQAAGVASAVGANSVRTVYFSHGSTDVKLAPDATRQLIDAVRSAPLIVLRGRTDGSTDSAAESRVARQRAEAVRAVLLQAGIEAARIRTTWQSIGDHVADNSSPAGRALNRRVEIESYRSTPMTVAAVPQPEAAAAE